jgi:hypothetical protein
MFTIFIALWGTANLILAIKAISKIKQNKSGLDFIWWWAFPSGAFVWEDMLIFGFLHAGLAFVSLLFGNTTLWLISFLVFWIVRSAGETLYFFLQQFIVPKHHPHDINSHFTQVIRMFGPISEQKCFILLQVIMQSILVLSIFGLILVLKNIY